MKQKQFKVSGRFIFMLTFFLHTINLMASSKVIYENAESGTTNNWSLYGHSSTEAIVKNVYNKDIDSRVIQFLNNNNSIYKLGNLSKQNSGSSIISWKMNFHDSFIIYISINTKDGFRHIFYTNADKNKGIQDTNYIHHGLGTDSNNGKWQTVTRDIEEDLHTFEPNNKLLSINAFMVKGDGMVDDIYSESSSDNNIKSSSNLGGDNFPKCNKNNPEVLYIKKLDDWKKINDLDKRIFCVKPNLYFSKASQDNILITSSGTDTKKRYILLDNGNNSHPGKLRHTQLAKVRFTFKNAKHWVVDRMSFWGNSKEYIIKFKQSDDILINRYLLEDTNYGMFLYPETENVTIQNSRFERNSLIVFDNAAIGLTNNNKDNIAIKNTHILNNEIYNYNDPFQSIKTGLSNQKNINYEGTLIEGNHFYVDEKLYTDCHGNLTKKGICSFSENAIDLKAGSENPNNKMIIRNNKMWGFRKSDKTRSNMSDAGVAIVIHFNVKNVEISHNLIFDSTHSIISSVSRNGYAMQNSKISDNIFYDIKNRAFYIGEAKNIVMTNNLFRKTSDKGDYWGIIDRVKNIEFKDNIISSTPKHYKNFYFSGNTQSGSFSNNIVYGEEIPSNLSDGFIFAYTDPTAQYQDLVFVTDRYTNNPRTIRIKRVLKN